MDAPKRATAAQLANRKITRGRGAKRLGTSSPAPSFSASTPLASQQTFSNIPTSFTPPTTEFQFAPATTVKNPFELAAQSQQSTPTVAPHSISPFGQSDDEMHTSPDYTPPVNSVPQSQLFSFVGRPTKTPSAETPTQSNTSKLFFQSAQPSSTPAPAMTTAGSLETPKKTPRLFANMRGTSIPQSATQTANSSETPKATPNVFANIKIPSTWQATSHNSGPLETPKPSTNLFANLKMPSTSKVSTETPAALDTTTANTNIFSNGKMPTQTTEALKTPKPSTTLFANLKMPQMSQASMEPPKALSTSTAKPNPFSSMKPSTQTTETLKTPTPSTALFADFNMPSMSQASTETPKVLSTSTANTNIFSNINTSTQTTKVLETPTASPNLFARTKIPSMSQASSAPVTAPTISSSTKTDETTMGTPPPAPAHFTAAQTQQYVTGFRLRSLNEGFQKHVAGMTALEGLVAAARFYLEKREEILAVGGLPLEGLSSNKRKADGDEPTDVDTPLNKRAKSDTAAAPAFKMPTFGTGAPANFMAQFGQSAAEAERKEKEKRKAEDFDSDEDDEEEWERRYAEERRAKKQKLAQAAKGKTAVFVPGKGFVLADGGESGGAAVEEKAGADAAKAAASTGGGLFGSGASTPSTAGGASVFDSPDLAAQQKTLSNNNIFGHLSDADSGVDGSKTGDADDEDTSSEGDDAENDTVDDASKPPAQAPPTADAPDKRAESSEPDDLQSILRKSRAVQSASKEKTETGKSTLQSSTSGRSLFDRISKDDNGNKSTALNPSSTAFGYSVKPADDHTWKQDNPIKFGASGTAPSFVLTSATPTKSTPVEDKSTPPSPFTGLFGGPKPSVESPTKLPSNTSGTPTKTADVGFGFGGPPKSVASTFLIPSAPASATTSRATSPGMTTDTGGESANESTAEGAEAEKTVDAQQLNLLTGGPGEEDEDVVFEVRAKAMMWVSNTKDDVTKAGWVNKGLGPLRVLKDRQSGKCRIIVRLDPSGRLILNAALLAGVGYQHQSPSVVKLAAASEDGKLNTWIVKVRKDDDAIKLARILEENKPRN